MNKLEERLKEISKVYVTDAEVNHAKLQILSKTKKKHFELTPIIVTGLMFVVMCILIFMPTSKSVDRATSIFTDDIREIHYLVNNRPNINLRAESFNYILMKAVLKQQQLEDFNVVLKEAQHNVQPWTEKLDGILIYELAVVMENGEVYRLKYDAYDASQDAVVIYDIKNKLKYVAQHNENTIAFNRQLDYEISSQKNLGEIFGFGLAILILIITVSHFYRKRFGLLDERGKSKRLKGWAHYIPYFLFILPIIFMVHIVGTFHLGLVLILIFLHSLITSQLEMKMGIIRPNNIHFKFLLPLYSLCVVIALILILVV